MVGEKLLMITNYRDELLKFYVKKYNDYNVNITLEDLNSFLNQKFPNLDDNQKLAKVYDELRSKLTNEEKDEHLKMSNSEQKVYVELKDKRRLKKDNLENESKKALSNKNGFVNVIYASIILIFIVIIYLILIK